MKNSKGFTLIELAVVLAIIAVLAAVLTPVVTGYLEQARLSRAAADVRTIADAIKLYKADTGVYPFFNTATDADTGTSAAIAGGSTYVAGSGGSAIAALSAATATTTLEAYLNSNVKTRSTTAGGGRTRFNGPYVGNVDGDPWNNKYYVRVNNLGSDATNWAFVASAGPNGTLDTTSPAAKTAAFSVGGSDDIAAPIH